MRRSVAILLCVFSCISLPGRNGRTSIFTDVTSIIMNRNINLGFSHSFTTHFSVEGSASFGLGTISRTSAEEKEHNSTLAEENDINWGDSKASCPELRIGFRFWPEKFFETWYISASCAYSPMRGTDLIIGAGYAVRIWKGLGLTAGYELRIIDSLKKGEFGSEGITIGINYTF